MPNSAQSMKEYTGTALITGGCSGLGYEIAKQLAVRNYQLLLISNNYDNLLRVSEELKTKYKVNVFVLFMDLADTSAAQKIYNWCKEHNITVDVLVNNAGMFFFGELVETSPEKVQQMLLLHIYTTSILCNLFGREMKKNRNGYILNISSLASYMPYPGIACYSASKCFLRYFSRSLRTEMLDYNVSVSCACPGAISTNLYQLSSTGRKKALRFGIMMKPDKAAKIIVKAMFNKKFLIIPGLVNWLFLFFVKIIPQSIIVLVRRYSNLLPPDK